METGDLIGADLAFETVYELLPPISQVRFSVHLLTTEYYSRPYY